ncbi:LysR family transcriptional regulator [Paracoccus sp. DMF-8]|uniref:LysR family transcriptional regulator n=1 Tax=Paracoccus sp. DMF-8 TaxID=3019445 RepID=UPI0023E789CC|nr:LysR family transcriptional regulator [Paracoccus sp. DMF-8]MDF3606478.1 LysR family transcriptional regulator [Paracoccus sp. DMF-8]
MLIRHLDFFVTLADEQHFGRAAALCGVSQPALSLAIRKLEEDLGTTLILRGQRFMGLTAEGQKVLQWGRQILADYGHLRDDLMGRRKGGLTGRLRLGVVASAMPLVPQISALFETRNPLARIAISLLPAPEIAGAIGRFDIDGAVSETDGRPVPGLRALPLGPQKLIFACPSGHPFADDPTITWREAITQPLCSVDGAIAAHLDARQVAASIACATLDGVLAHLRLGQWCALVPECFAALLAPDDDIILREIAGGGLRLAHAVLLPQRDPPSPMVNALADCIAALGDGVAGQGTP